MTLKNIINSLVLALFLGVPFAAYSAGGAGNQLVTYIEVQADGGIIIEGAAPFNNPDSCQTGNNNRIYIPADNQFINQYYAAALTAYSTNNLVWAWLSGCWTTPWNQNLQYPMVVNAGTRAQ